MPVPDPAAGRSDHSVPLRPKTCRAARRHQFNQCAGLRRAVKIAVEAGNAEGYGKLQLTIHLVVQCATRDRLKPFQRQGRKWKETIVSGDWWIKTQPETGSLSVIGMQTARPALGEISKGGIDRRSPVRASPSVPASMHAPDDHRTPPKGTVQNCHASHAQSLAALWSTDYASPRPVFSEVPRTG